MRMTIHDSAVLGRPDVAVMPAADGRSHEAMLKAGALQSAIFNSANFSSIATDAKGVIQIFNVGAERMLGYAAAEVMNKITPADISDPQEVIARAAELSLELAVALDGPLFTLFGTQFPMYRAFMMLVALLKAGALQSAIFNSANFSSIATDANGVIQIFNVGAERMLG